MLRDDWQQKALNRWLRIVVDCWERDQENVRAKNKGSQLFGCLHSCVRRRKCPAKVLEIEPGAELKLAVIARVKGE